MIWMRCLLGRTDAPVRAAGLTQACGLFLVLLVLVSTAFPQDRIDAGADQQMLAMINQARAQEGLSPVELNESLTRAALKHTQLMIQSDSLQHQFAGEEALSLRLSDEHARCDSDGENIALDSTVAGAHAMLMQSPPHRANILNRQFNAVGIAVVQSGELLYVTEDFAHVLPNYSEFEADAAAQQAINDFVRAHGLPVPSRKVRPQLAQMACEMALDDKLDSAKTRDIPGATRAVTWTATDLGKLPTHLKKLLEQPLDSGYALGVCYAPSVSHPGSVYWLVMVIY